MIKITRDCWAKLLYVNFKILPLTLGRLQEINKLRKRREDSEETSQELRLAREQLQNTVREKWRLVMQTKGGLRNNSGGRNGHVTKNWFYT